MSVLFTNNGTSRLLLDHPANATTITVMAGEGSRFPSPTAPDYCTVTLEDRRTSQIEICKCTARSGDSLTVVRAQEGTTAQMFLAGATVSNRLTAELIANFAGTPEAPYDGKIYGRQDSSWVETIRKTDYNTQLVAQDTRDDGQDAKLSTHTTQITTLQSDVVRIDGVNAAQDAGISANTSKNVQQDTRLDNVETKNNAQDIRLDSIETKNGQQDTRLTAVEAKNTSQDTEILANTNKNATQDTRLTAIEAKNTSQDAAIGTKITEAPIDGQTYGRQTGGWVDVTEEAPADGVSYGRKNGTWVASVGGAVVAEAAPGGPLISGQLWWESDSGNLFVYYDDASSKQWVQVASATGGGSGGGGGGSGVPIGSIVDFAGTVVPQGWMMCFGQTMSRVLYGSLFAAIGTAYGAGDGSTTFNLPDCRGRVAAGKDDMGGTSANRLTSLFNGDLLGAAGGTELEALDITKMPSHTHVATSGTESADHTHYTTSSGNSGYISVDHSHNLYANSGGENVGHQHSSTAVSSGSGTPGLSYFSSGNVVGQFTTSERNAGHVHLMSANTGGISANHYHGVTVGGTSGGRSAAHTHSISVTAQGGDVAHNNVQPTIVFNKLIKVV